MLFLGIALCPIALVPTVFMNHVGCALRLVFRLVRARGIQRYGRVRRHLERILPVYRARRDSLLDAMQAYFPADLHWTKPAGGFFVWVRLPEGVSALEFFRLALKNGISVAPSAVFYPGVPVQNAFRLAFSHYPEDVLVRAPPGHPTP